MEPDPYFTPALFAFLKELEKNNNREWFTKNKARYEETVQEPGVRFIRDAGMKLKALTPHLVADARPFGGSMMRIYRDVRFSRDKSPYRTVVGIHFSHKGAAGRMDHLPGFYVHLEPGESQVMSGVWQPDPPTATKIRDTIVKRPDDWKKVLKGRLNFEGESLKRIPPGYDPANPYINDIRRKDWVSSVRLNDRQVTGGAFMDEFLKACTTMDPLNAFLAKALGLPW